MRIRTTAKGFLFCFYPEQLGGQIHLMKWGAWGKCRDGEGVAMGDILADSI